MMRNLHLDRYTTIIFHTFSFIIICRNLRELLNEAHNHTMLNPRAAAAFQHLAGGRKLGKGRFQNKNKIKWIFCNDKPVCTCSYQTAGSWDGEHFLKHISISVILCWDSVDIEIPKVSNQRTQKRTFTTKHNCNALRRYYLLYL